jgi:hypothetical protein
MIKCKTGNTSQMCHIKYKKDQQGRAVFYKIISFLICDYFRSLVKYISQQFGSYLFRALFILYTGIFFVFVIYYFDSYNNLDECTTKVVLHNK